jgi:thiol:disulfide interchange protein DsbD
MTRRTTLSVGVALLLATLSALAGHTRAQLVLAAETVRGGETVWAAIRLQMDPGWHVYWKNPGGAGMATTVEWDLPPGVTAGEIQWPIPDKAEEDGLITFIYETDAALLVPLRVDRGLAPGLIEIKARLKWLECGRQCLLGGAAVRAELTLGAETVPSQDAPRFEHWRQEMPLPAAEIKPSAWWEQEGTGDLRPLVVAWDAAPGTAEADFFPDASDDYEIQEGQGGLAVEGERMELRKQVKRLAHDWPRDISGLLVRRFGSLRQAYQVSLPVQDPASGAAQIPAASERCPANGASSASRGGRWP